MKVRRQRAIQEGNLSDPYTDGDRWKWKMVQFKICGVGFTFLEVQASVELRQSSQLGHQRPAILILDSHALLEKGHVITHSSRVELLDRL
jgi:hypothetical protein